MFCGAVISGEIIYVLGQFFSPTESAGEAQAATLKMSELKPDRAVSVRCGDLPVLVVKHMEGEKEELLAYSAVCTHLGCLVNWVPASEAKKFSNIKSSYVFFCPCHDGVFGPHGEVLAGPAPLPLEKVQVTVKGDDIIVGGMHSGLIQ